MHCVGVSGRWKGLGLFLLLTEEVIVGLSYILQHGTGWRGKGRGMDGESFFGVRLRRSYLAAKRGMYFWCLKNPSVPDGRFCS